MGTSPRVNGVRHCKIILLSIAVVTLTIFRPYEITVNGKRQGVTKKKLDTPQAAMSVSKYKLMLIFLDLLRCSSELRDKFQLELSDLEKLTYARCKSLASDYQLGWNQLKSNYFEQWTSKPKELLEFTN